MNLKKAILFTLILSTPLSVYASDGNKQFSDAAVIADNGKEIVLENSKLEIADGNGFAVKAADSGKITGNFTDGFSLNTVNKTVNDFIGISAVNNGEINLTAGNDIMITTSSVKNGSGSLTSAVKAESGAKIDLSSTNGSITVALEEDTNFYYKPGDSNILSADGAEIALAAAQDISLTSKVSPTIAYEDDRAFNNGLFLKNSSSAEIKAGNNININVVTNAKDNTTYNTTGIMLIDSSVNITAGNNISIKVGSSGTKGVSAGILLGNRNQENDTYAYIDDSISTIRSENGGVSITSEAEGFGAAAIGIFSNQSKLEVSSKYDNNITVSADHKNAGDIHGIEAMGNVTSITVISEEGSNFIEATGEQTDKSIGIYADKGAEVRLQAAAANRVTADEYGVYIGYHGDNRSSVALTAGVNYIDSKYAVFSYKDGDVRIDALNGDNTINSVLYGVKTDENSTAEITAAHGLNIIHAGSREEADHDIGDGFSIYPTGILTTFNSSAVLEADGNFIEGYNGIKTFHASSTSLLAGTQGNTIINEHYSVYADTSSEVNITADGGDNIIISEKAAVISGNADPDYSENIYSGAAAAGANITVNGRQNIIMAGKMDYGSNYYNGTAIAASDGAKISVTGSVLNHLNGIVESFDKDTVVDIVSLQGADNYIVSSAYITDKKYIADDSGTDNAPDSYIYTAVFNDGGTVNISAGEGGYNYIATDISIDKEQKNAKERVIWSQDGSINISGVTVINASNGSIDEPNSVGIAIAAGTATSDSSKEASVNAQLGAGSYIYGDILAGAGGEVNLAIKEDASAVKSSIHGNILSANGGSVNVDIGENSIFTGRVDAYMDADESHWTSGGVFAPEFSEDIESSGEIKLSMGKGSVWQVSGQSWITELNVRDGALIDMTDLSEFHGASSLTVQKLVGDNDEATVDGVFRMSLDHDNHHDSDMLYIKNSSGKYDIEVVGDVNGLEKVYTEGLRFATVAGEAKLGEVRGIDGGAYNVVYEIDDTQQYYGDESQQHNNEYNNSSLDQDKPGSSSVDGLFDDIDDKNSIHNWQIVGFRKTGLSDEGKTIVNMTKANYTNGIYPDRLDKRQGQMRFVDENDGLWVRLRHDRVGKEAQFCSMNTMYEIGYDWNSRTANGSHHYGLALDYMDGKTSYDGINGEGEEKRKGLWLYDTWMGDDGSYSDYVLKWGHFDNSFDFVTASSSDKVTGDYDNDVFSVSAEYGWKKDLGSSWYLIPQLQLQYAYLTEADYMVTQSGRAQTDVRVDSIDSLLGRIGFRLGREFTDGSGRKFNAYIKGDILREFLGEQNVYLKDGTTVQQFAGEDYDHSGTWYDLGIGLAASLGKNSYAFIDFEKSFGNDFEDTYQINGGVQWTF